MKEMVESTSAEKESHCYEWFLSADGGRLEVLEEEVAALREQLEALRAAFEAFRAQFE